jgi:hypothetical protein
MSEVEGEAEVAETGFDDWLAPRLKQRRFPAEVCYPTITDLAPSIVEARF